MALSVSSPGMACPFHRNTSSLSSSKIQVSNLSPPFTSFKNRLGTVVAVAVTSASVKLETNPRTWASVYCCSSVICRSAPTVASTVFSSTNVPVYPCTAASVTIESVSSIMTARRFTDSAEPEPFKPRLTSFSRGVLPRMSCMICGPRAPIRPSSKAPPIQRANGPMIPSKPLIKKLRLRPSSLPLSLSQASVTASIPNEKESQ